MITIITGTPGAGKTLYTIEKLLQPLVGTSITYTDDQGGEVTAPRTIYTNINGLLLDHELIDGGDKQGLRDWFKWAKPGSVIVFDEVQRHWKPRANGSAVPPDIEALETHRHMGVDFIVITQNVLLVDKNIHALAGRHLHVRRIATMPMAIVYEWDHVSRALLYAKSLTKSPWRYSKKIFKLYKSAEVHTKQPRSIPGAVWFIVVALIGTAILAPTTYSRLTDRINGKTDQSSVVDASKTKTPASSIGARSGHDQLTKDGPVIPQSPLQVQASFNSELTRFSGCIGSRSRCECFGQDGTKFEKDLGFCEVYTAPSKYLLAGGTIPENVIPPPPPPPPTLIASPRDNTLTLANVAAMYRGR